MFQILLPKCMPLPQHVQDMFPDCTQFVGPIGAKPIFFRMNLDHVDFLNLLLIRQVKIWDKNKPQNWRLKFASKL